MTIILKQPSFFFKFFFWEEEKIQRRATSQGHRTEVVDKESRKGGSKNNTRGTIDDENKTMSKTRHRKTGHAGAGQCLGGDPRRITIS